MQSNKTNPRPCEAHTNEVLEILFEIRRTRHDSWSYHEWRT